MIVYVQEALSFFLSMVGAWCLGQWIANAMCDWYYGKEAEDPRL